MAISIFDRFGTNGKNPWASIVRMLDTDDQLCLSQVCVSSNALVHAVIKLRPNGDLQANFFALKITHLLSEDFISYFRRSEIGPTVKEKFKTEVRPIIIDNFRVSSLTPDEYKKIFNLYKAKRHFSFVGIYQSLALLSIMSTASPSPSPMINRTGLDKTEGSPSPTVNDTESGGLIREICRIKHHHRASEVAETLKTITQIYPSVKDFYKEPKLFTDFFRLFQSVCILVSQKLTHKRSVTPTIRAHRVTSDDEKKEASFVQLQPTPRRRTHLARYGTLLDAPHFFSSPEMQVLRQKDSS